MTHPDPPGGEPATVVLGPAPQPLDPARRDEAAAILAAATGAGTPEAGETVLTEAAIDPDRRAYGLTVDGRLVAVYVTRKAGLAMEVTHLAVAEGARRRGYGRACLVDALRRAGKRPLVVETDDEGLGFYKACGFKLVGKRRHPSGTIRYRLGWHAPRPRTTPRDPSSAGAGAKSAGGGATAGE